MKVLILGGTGTIGRVVVKAIQEKVFRNETSLIVHGRSARAQNQPSGVEYISCNLKSPAEISKILEEVSILIHCAREDYNTHANSPVLEHILLNAPRYLKRIVHVGSVGFLDTGTGEINLKTSAGICDTSYDRHKANSEMLLEAISKKYAISCVSVMPSIVVNESYSSQWSIDILADLYCGQIALPARGSGICNVSYVNDIAFSIVKYCDTSFTGYHRCMVVSDAVFTWQEIYRSHAKALKLQFRQKPFKTNRRSLIISKLRRRFNLRRAIAKKCLKNRDNWLNKKVLRGLAMTNFLFTCPQITGSQERLYSSTSIVKNCAGPL